MTADLPPELEARLSRMELLAERTLLERVVDRGVLDTLKLEVRYVDAKADDTASQVCDLVDALNSAGDEPGPEPASCPSPLATVLPAAS